MKIRTSRKKKIILAVGAAGLLLTACGGGGDDNSTDAEPQIVVLGDDTADSGSEGEIVGVDEGTGDGAGGGETLAADATEEEQALAFAQCMRDEGIDWPDPTTNADGSIDLFGGAGRGDGQGGGGVDDGRRAAFDICGSLVEGASFLPGGAGGFDAETQDSFLEFTQCLRDNGVDIDDPDFSNPGGDGDQRGRFGGSFDPQDPANADAIEACQGLFAGAGRPGAGQDEG